MKDWTNSMAGIVNRLRAAQQKLIKRHRLRPLTRRLRMEALENRQLLSITVNTLADENDGIGVGGISLRDAIDAATSGELIKFSVDGTITLTHGELVIPGKTLAIDATGHSITIDASGSDSTPDINDYNGSRIYNIVDPTSGVSPPSVTLVGLKMQGGDAPGPGGAILSTGSLTLRDDIITDNSAFTLGAVHLSVGAGGTVSRTVLNIENTHVDGNTSNEEGGGVFVIFQTSAGGHDSVVINSSSISNNRNTWQFAYGPGFCVINASGGENSVTIRNSQLNGNQSTGGLLPKS